MLVNELNNWQPTAEVEWVNLVSARQGIFQVTAENSTDLSDYGVYDTSTIDKVVKIVVTLSYTIN